MKVKPILILPEHSDKVKAGELWVLAHCQPRSGRIVGLWGRLAKRQTAEVSASPRGRPLVGRWTWPTAARWELSKRGRETDVTEMPSSTPYSTGVSLLSVCHFKATHVDAEMHHTGLLFLLVLSFPRNMPQKERNLAGLKLGSLHLGSLNCLKG